MSGPTGTHFPGTQAESFELLAALSHNCTCAHDAEGRITDLCAPHRMLAEDQRAIDGLLFERHIRDRLMAEEWPDGLPEPAP